MPQFDSVVEIENGQKVQKWKWKEHPTFERDHPHLQESGEEWKNDPGKVVEKLTGLQAIREKTEKEVMEARIQELEDKLEQLSRLPSPSPVAQGGRREPRTTRDRERPKATSLLKPPPSQRKEFVLDPVQPEDLRPSGLGIRQVESAPEPQGARALPDYDREEVRTLSEHPEDKTAEELYQEVNTKLEALQQRLGIR